MSRIHIEMAPAAPIAKKKKKITLSMDIYWWLRLGLVKKKSKRRNWIVTSVKSLTQRERRRDKQDRSTTPFIWWNHLEQCHGLGNSQTMIVLFKSKVWCDVISSPQRMFTAAPSEQQIKQLKGSVHYMKSKLNKNNAIYRKVFITVLRYEKKLQS